MDKNLIGWIATGSVLLILILFVVMSEVSYFSALKEQKIQLQNQLNEKSQELTEKNNKISDLDNQKKDLEGKNEDLGVDLEAKRKELDRRIEQVKKLQGSVKIVGRCLLGTMGVIEAFRRNDEGIARKSVLLMEETCEESGRIIQEIEKFPTNSQTANY